MNASSYWFEGLHGYNWQEGFCTVMLMSNFRPPVGVEYVYWHWEIHGPKEKLHPTSANVTDFEFGPINWEWA